MTHQRTFRQESVTVVDPGRVGNNEGVAGVLEYDRLDRRLDDGIGVGGEESLRFQISN